VELNPMPRWTTRRDSAAQVAIIAVARVVRGFARRLQKSAVGASGTCQSIDGVAPLAAVSAVRCWMLDDEEMVSGKEGRTEEKLEMRGSSRDPLSHYHSTSPFLIPLSQVAYDSVRA
jgi:hypothetical protein